MMSDLTGFQRDLLFVLSGMGAPSGSDIMAELERSQDRDVLRGRLYSNLDTLVEQGLVEKGKADGRTNCYTITTRGLDQLEARHEWERQRLRSDGQGADGGADSSAPEPSGASAGRAADVGMEPEFEGEHDPDRSVAQTIVRGISATKGVDETDLEPLYDSLELDALQRLLRHSTESEGYVGVEFTIDEYTVLVRSDETVRVYEGDPATARADRERRLNASAG